MDYRPLLPYHHHFRTVLAHPERNLCIFVSEGEISRPHAAYLFILAENFRFVSSSSRSRRSSVRMYRQYGYKVLPRLESMIVRQRPAHFMKICSSNSHLGFSCSTLSTLSKARNPSLLSPLIAEDTPCILDFISHGVLASPDDKWLTGRDWVSLE